MYCPKCGAENDDSNKFCKECGFPLEKIKTEVIAGSGNKNSDDGYYDQQNQSDADRYNYVKNFTHRSQRGYNAPVSSEITEEDYKSFNNRFRIGLILFAIDIVLFIIAIAMGTNGIGLAKAVGWITTVVCFANIAVIILIIKKYNEIKQRSNGKKVRAGIQVCTGLSIVSIIVSIALVPAPAFVSNIAKYASQGGDNSGGENESTASSTAWNKESLVDEYGNDISEYGLRYDFQLKTNADNKSGDCFIYLDKNVGPVVYIDIHYNNFKAKADIYSSGMPYNLKVKDSTGEYTFELFSNKSGVLQLYDNDYDTGSSDRVRKFIELLYNNDGILECSQESSTQNFAFEIDSSGFKQLFDSTWNYDEFMKKRTTTFDDTMKGIQNYYDRDSYNGLLNNN